MLQGTQRFAARLQLIGHASGTRHCPLLMRRRDMGIFAGTTADGYLLSGRDRVGGGVRKEGLNYSPCYDIPTSVTRRSAMHHQV